MTLPKTEIDGDDGRDPISASYESEAVRLFAARAQSAHAGFHLDAGIIRHMGVGAPTGATRIWMGLTVGPPGMDSGPHHHGEAETAGYVVRGHCRILWGEQFEQQVDVSPGDFVFIPAYLPHIEQNRSDEPVELIIARSPDNIVVNLG